MATLFTYRLAASTCGIATVAVLLLAPLRLALPADLRLSARAEAAQMPESDLWLAPAMGGVGSSELSRAIDDLAAGQASQASVVFARTAADPVLGGYSRLYLGRADLALNRAKDAADAARGIISSNPGGYLGEAALWLLADADEASSSWQDAADALGALADLRSNNPSLALLRLARAAEKVGDLSAARAAYARVYYDHPLSAEAPAAGTALSRLPAADGPELYKQQLARAQALFTGRRYADARKAYEELRGRTASADRVLVDLRLAECDSGLQRFQAAYDQLRALLDRAGPLRVEAEFYVVGAVRGLKRNADYPAKVAEFVSAYPTDPLAEAALNDLATAYILGDDDASAATVFTDMQARFPRGAFADRAAWKAGWFAYKNGRYREAIRLFEAGVTNQPKADYRPSWLYWSARAHEQLAEPEAALTWYRRTVADYRNSYYGRQATAAIARMVSRGRPAVALASSSRATTLTLTPGAMPANAVFVRRLLSAGLYDDAISELRKLQRDSGSSPLIEATIAYALNRKGDLRPAINTMRRAYPQFMAEGGESLPRPILAVIFPVDHEALLRRYAADRHIDPSLLLAQVAQESTFQADVRSSANAYGLMQILPSTGRRYAPKVGIRGFSVARLTDPEVNVRIGTQYFADLIDMYGGDVAPALAAYNAGEGRVSKWRAERPGIDRDAFIDDIPFPETQNYVKRILGTADDYRHLYGDGARPAASLAR